MNEQTSAKPPARLFHLDNLRIYLTVLVILVHANLAHKVVTKDPSLSRSALCSTWKCRGDWGRFLDFIHTGRSIGEV